MTGSGSQVSVLPWQVGDVVIDARGWLYQRGEPVDSREGIRTWGTVKPDLSPQVSGWLLPDDLPQRPLTLIIRDRKPVGGIEVSELPLAGETAAG